MAFNIPSYPDGPSFSDTLTTIKNSLAGGVGGIFHDIHLSTSSMATAASSFPGQISGELSSALGSVESAIASARANLPRTLSVAQSQMDALAKNKLAARTDGADVPTLSDTEIHSGSNALAVLRDGPKFLSEHATTVATSICTNNLVNSAFNLSTTDPTAVGAAVSSFMASVPPATLTVGQNPPVINPDYQTFISNPANSAKLAAIGIPQVDVNDVTQTLPVPPDNLSSAISGLASTITHKLSDLTSMATTGYNDAIANLKMNAAAMIFAASHNDTIADIKNQHIDATKINPLNMNKGAAIAAQYSPTTPPMNTRVNGYKSTANVLTEPTSTATATPAPEATVDDRVQRYELDYYYENVIQPLMEQDKSARETFMASPEYARVKPLKEKATAIKNAKPDESTRTQEEKDAIAEYNTVTAEVKQTQAYNTHITAVNAFNAENRRYKTAVNAYATNASRTTLDAETRSHLPKG